MRLIPMIGLAAVGLWAAGAAWGQSAMPGSSLRARNINNLISRPSQGTSIVGGAYTSQAEVRALGATKRGVALLGRDNFEFMRSRGRNVGRMLEVGELGLYRAYAPPGGAPLSEWYRRTGELTNVSGLASTMTLTTPLRASRRGAPALDAHRFTPQIERTSFAQTFGLLPGGPRPEPDEKLADIAANVRENADARRAFIRARGLALFKEATASRRDPRTGGYPDCADCGEKFETALRLLRIVRETSEKDALPALLLAHGALEQDRPMLAVNQLLTALKEDPELFRKPAQDLHAYFGDAEASGTSQTLESQMRRYANAIRDNLTDSFQVSLLQSYCAWRLGDNARARQAAEAAYQMLQSAGALENAPAMSMARVLMEQ